MAFWSKTFIYDGIPSETYKLFIISPNANGVITNVGSTDVSIYSQKVYRNPKPYYFGVEMAPVLTFDLSFASLTPIDAYDQSAIQTWLFGHQYPRKLQVQQCDYEYLYFNCYLTNPEITHVGNFAYSFKCTAVCDAPWAWEFPKTREYGPLAYDEHIIVNNQSDSTYYDFPIVEFTLGTAMSDILVRNERDGSGFNFTGLVQGETIYMDGQRGIIRSSRDLNRFDNFDGRFLRLMRGLNNITIDGAVTSFKLTTQEARRVSG